LKTWTLIIVKVTVKNGNTVETISRLWNDTIV